MLREIENIRHDASLLKEQMNLVKEDIRVVKVIFLSLKTYLWPVVLGLNFVLVFGHGHKAQIHIVELYSYCILLLIVLF